MRIIATSASAAFPPAGGTAGAPVASRPRHGLNPVDLLVCLGVLLLFCLSGYALEYFGVPYVSDGGSILTKLHPAFYVFGLALLLAVVANPDPLTYGLGLAARRPGSIALIVACAIIYVFISRYKAGMSAAYLGDAMISAAMVALLMADTSEAAHRWLARMLHAIVITNALLAIVEVSTHWRLFPFGVAGSYMTWDYRATALFGHPLDGALATGVYAVILLTVPQLPGLAPKLRLPVILLCMAAMPAIGARTSFAIVYLVAAVTAALALFTFLRGRTQVSHATLLLVLAGAAVLPLAAAAAYDMGYLDGFLGRFQDDSGSAGTRLSLYNLFSRYGLMEMFTGYSQVELRTRIRIEGLESGVENAWVGHLLQFGVPLAVMLWSALAAFLADIIRVAGRHAIVPIIFTLLVISTSVGISGKTTMLVMPVTIMLILLGRPDATGRRPLSLS